LVFQYPENQLFDETVYKDIAFGPLNMGLNADEIKERVYEALGHVKLPENVLESSPFELSGGQKRRAAIARGQIALSGTPAEVYSQHETLTSIGLNVPAVTKIFAGLKARGIPVDDNIYTMDQAVDEISKIARTLRSGTASSTSRV
jgi:ABC-type phosphate transport system ATPase subunit